MHRISLFRNIAVNLILLVSVGVLYLGTMSSALSVTVANVDPPYYEGDRGGNNVSFMINVYMGTEYVEEMLETLQRYGAKTTFFVGGTWAEKNPETLKKIVSYGNEIGNHGYLHKDSDKLSEKRLTDEITLCHRVVKQLCGADMTLFAPPSGAFDNQTLKVAKANGYQTVMWTRDTIDWRDKDENIVYSRAIKNIKGGDLILMHPTAHSAAALPRILEELKKSGLTANTVSATLGRGA